MDLVDPSAERYAVAHTSGPDASVAALRAETVASTSVPQMAGGHVEAKLLEALVVATRATRMLEVGTFTGVSAISMASRLADGGKLITLEADPANAEIARRHIAASPVADRIEMVFGDALRRSTRSKARSTSSSSTPGNRTTRPITRPCCPNWRHTA